MAIHLIAKALYALEQEVEKLEARVKSAPPEQREGLKDELRRVKAERDRMRRTLDGAKEPPPFRVPR